MFMKQSTLFHYVARFSSALDFISIFAQNVCHFFRLQKIIQNLYNILMTEILQYYNFIKGFIREDTLSFNAANHRCTSKPYNITIRYLTTSKRICFATQRHQMVFFNVLLYDCYMIVLIDLVEHRPI